MDGFLKSFIYPLSRNCRPLESIEAEAFLKWWHFHFLTLSHFRKKEECKRIPMVGHRIRSENFCMLIGHQEIMSAKKNDKRLYMIPFFIEKPRVRCVRGRPVWFLHLWSEGLFEFYERMPFFLLLRLLEHIFSDFKTLKDIQNPYFLKLSSKLFKSPTGNIMHENAFREMQEDIREQQEYHGLRKKKENNDGHLEFIIQNEISHVENTEFEKEKHLDIGNYPFHPATYFLAKNEN
jgi:hypothetical protein